MLCWILSDSDALAITRWRAELYTTADVCQSKGTSGVRDIYARQLVREAVISEEELPK